MPENLLYSPSLGQDDYPERLKQLRAMVDPAPGWDYGNILPMAWNQQGEVRPAVPQAARQALQGYIDLLASPYTGGITAPAFENMLGGTVAPPGSGEAMLASGPVRPWGKPKMEPAGIRAYHGSPHDFEQFDISKIGTGEGAQAYGHGLYFAGKEGVAKSYRDRLSDRGNWRIKDVQNGDDQELLDTVVKYFNAHSDGGDFASTRATIAENAKAFRTKADFMRVPESYADAENPGMRNAYYRWKFNDQNAKELENVLDWANNNRDRMEMGSGHMYEVGINAQPEQFINWDKPLSEQPPGVQKFFEGMDPTDLASHAYNRFQHYLGPEQTREKFREAGISGIKYADAGSRVDPGLLQQYRRMVKAQETQPLPGVNIDVLKSKLAQMEDKAANQSSNYVVFDDKMISILKKYGLSGIGPGSMIPGALSQSQPQQPQQIPNALLPQIMGNQS